MKYMKERQMFDWKQTEFYKVQDNMPFTELVHIYTQNHNIICRTQYNEKENETKA